MRPISLEATGFTCYREKQPPLEFDKLSLFAISGSTGAGKSSILDAMLYALYGEVPRIGKQGVSELIAHGCDALSVSLDFRAKGCTYRVVRRVKRGKTGALQTAAMLADISGGVEQNLADGVKPVNEAVVRILGLDFSAFTQTVILPQGEFAKFLKAKPADQRTILQDLLGHHVYTRMREGASERRTKLSAELVALDRQLQATEHATDEQLKAKRKALASAVAEQATVDKEHQQQQAALTELRRRRDLTEEAQGHRSRRQQLEAETTRITQAEDELVAARRAAGILPRLESFNKAVARRTEAGVRLEAARQELKSLEQQQKKARSAAELAAKAAEPCADMAARIQALDEIKGDLDRRVSLAADIATRAKQLQAAQERVAQATQGASTTQAALDQARRVLEDRRATLAGSGYDAALSDVLDTAWQTVLQLKTSTSDLQRETSASEKARQAVTTAILDVGAYLSVLNDAERHAAEALAAAREASTALAEGQLRSGAAAMRPHLHVGDACPVCQQVVHELPPAEATPELDELAIALSQAEAARDAADQQLQKVRGHMLTLQAKQTSAEAARDEAVQRVGSLLVRAEQLRAHLVGYLLGRAEGWAPDAPEAWVEVRRDELRQARDRHTAAENAVREAESASSKAEIELATRTGEARSAAEALTAAEQQLAAARADQQALVARIAAVSTHDDPSEERRALAGQVSTLEKAAKAAQAALATIASAFAAATATAAAAATAATQATDAEAADAASLREALAAAQFTTPEAAQAAARTAAQQAALDTRIRSHREALSAVTTRLLAIEPEIAGREVSAEAFGQAESAAVVAAARSRDAVRTVSTLQGECDRLAEDVATRAAAVVQREAVSDRLGVAAEMANDLKGDAFQEYLLEEAFTGLVQGASVRMRQMSGRYTLAWQKGDFFVVDHDNAGDRRRAETLSGGETFMASLCLALQLSEEVLRSSGALQMDSLFIDEGFGTLDSETLAEVTDAMETLRQDGARLIGVISHRPELTDRLPGCIRVVKGSGQSFWVMERAG